MSATGTSALPDYTPVLRPALGFRDLYADALFASGLQPCDEPGATQARQAIALPIRAFGCSDYAGKVAQGFGGHPETAIIRMRALT
jgi:hypothetical protein